MKSINKKTTKLIFQISVLVAFIFFAQKTQAVEATRIHLDQNTVQKGYTVTHDQNKLRFAVTPNQVEQPVKVVLKSVDSVNHELPSGTAAISSFYTFDMRGTVTNPIIVHKPSWLAVSYVSENSFTNKAIYNYDSNKNVWIKMPSFNDAAKHEVRAITHLPFSLVAVLESEYDFSQDDFDINSPYAALMDADTGQIIWQKNGNEQRSIASLTKLMNVMVFLDTETSFDKVVAMETEDNSAIGAKLYVSAGETMTVRDLFYTTLVGSANNAALALARSTGLSRQEFVSRMNAKAQALGLIHTQYADPSGLDTENKSTAAEMAVVAREAFKRFAVLQATTAKEYTFTTISKGIYHRIKNTNKLLDSNFYVTGGKTGYLDEAGECLAMKIKNPQGKSIISIVLGADTSAIRFNDTEDLLNWGLDIIQ